MYGWDYPLPGYGLWLKCCFARRKTNGKGDSLMLLLSDKNIFKQLVSANARINQDVLSSDRQIERRPPVTELVGESKSIELACFKKGAPTLASL